MTKFFSFVITCCILMSCSHLMSSESFFSTISTEDIPDLAIGTIPFRKSFLDDDCPKCGTIEEPLYELHLKYDTLSCYRVIIIGRVVFGKKNNYKNQFERIDSVGIKRMVVSRRNFPRELYGSDQDSDWNNKRWEECPLPRKILKLIRKDFLVRMKYRRYLFNDSVLDDGILPIKGYTTMYDYHLY